jgi:protein gp37
MAEQTAIEWTDATWTPIRARHLKTGKIGWHCVHKSDGCKFCYADGINRRLGTGLPFKPGHEKDIEIFLDEKMLLAPLRWKRPRMVFVCSMTDLFADFVREEWIDRMLAVMALCPQHTYQLLSKRPERMRDYLKRLEEESIRDTVKRFAKAMPPHPWPKFNDMTFPLANAWLGTSCEDQSTADERIPDLLDTPAAIHFVSYEPALGPVDFRNLRDGTYDALTGCGDRERLHDWEDTPALDWVIAGGESGPNARPAHPDWFRSVRDQCKAAGVPFFFKQWGEWAPSYGDQSRERLAVCRYGSAPFPIKAGENARQMDLLDRCQMVRVGKKAAGRLLDGVEHNEFPR